MAHRVSHIGGWLASGGAASLTLVLLTGAGAAVIAGSVVPRFLSPPFSQPAQQVLVYPGATPKISSIEPGAPVELGIVFRPMVAGTVSGLRFYSFDGEVGPYLGHLWTSDGKLLATARFRGGFGWQEVQLPVPVRVPANSLLIASYFSPAGGNIATGASFPAAGLPLWRPGAFALPPVEGRAVHVYRAGEIGFPTTAATDRGFWIDVVFVEAFRDDDR